MKKLLYLLSLALVVAGSVFLSTCKKHEVDKPTLTSLSPSSGHEGDAVDISGTFLGSAKKVSFGSVDAVVIDPKGGNVTTQVPAGLPLGPINVTVLTDGGTSNALTFTVIPPAPIIASINPVEGSAGMTVVISGQFFGTAKEVAFGTTKVTTLDPKTETQVTVKIPDGLALGATDVTLTSDGGISNKISFTVLAKPAITDFTPPAGLAGTHVTITGTSLEAVTHVFFGTVEGTFTAPVSTTQFEAVVPASATTGKIKVVTPGGEALSTNDFVVKGTPTITNFAPLSGVTGTEVTITGQNFQAPGLIVLFGTVQVASPTVNSDTELKVIVPADAATGKITVTTIAGTVVSASNFTVSTAPTIASFSPPSGPVGTIVVLTGTNFTGTTLVKFNGVTAPTFTVNSATQITVTVPAGATTGVIAVTTPQGSGSSSGTFTVQAPPTVTSFTPTSGIIGATITITGTGFTGATIVKFNGTSATFTVVSATSITATVPVGASNGIISVTTPAGSGASAASFTIVGAPTVTSFAPTSGAVGASIVITGTGFTGATAVKFNSVAAVTVAINSATQITATVPAGASNGPISVTGPGGTGNSASSFTVIGAPAITSFTPPSGPVGTVVVITGTSLTSATSVKFNGVSAVTFTVNSATQITATVPATATTGVIMVTTPVGSGSSTNSFTVVPPPTITSFTPTSGAVGQTIIITGTNFISVSSVKFNGTSVASPVTNSATQITAIIPAGATSGTITVVTPAGTATSPSSFTVAPAPTITSFTPATAAVGGNVVITGTNFINVSSVQFHGTAVTAGNYTVNSATQITAKVPAGTTNGTLTVTTPSGTGTSAASFTLMLPPTVTSFAPTSGVVGTSVVITGTSFTGSTLVKFNATTAVTFTVNSATQITATVPAGATTGAISVTNPAGTGTSASNFTMILAPLIGSISPITGTPGITLTILGSNLLNATSVKFGGTTVSTLISNTDSQIKVTVPALSPGAVNVSVVTAGGTSNTKTFTAVAAPVITDIKPGVSYKGFPIMVRGSNLAGTISASVGGTAATVMTAYDASVIITIPGSMANGTYQVTVSNEGGPSNGVSLNVITAPSGVGSPPSGNFVSPPPANYINAVSNYWTDPANPATEVFLLTTPGVTCQIESGNEDFYVCGSYVFTKDGTGNVTANYVEITRGTFGDPPTNLETFYGQWSATVPDPCFQKLVLISAKDGHILYATVNVEGQINYPSGTCH